MNTQRSANTESILKQIAETQNNVDSCLQRTEMLEKKLKHYNLTDSERTRIEKEIEDIKGLLKKNESDLKYFYGENSKIFFMCVMIMFFAFLFYGIYHMIYGNVKI